MRKLLAVIAMMMACAGCYAQTSPDVDDDSPGVARPITADGDTIALGDNGKGVARLITADGDTIVLDDNGEGATSSYVRPDTLAPTPTANRQQRDWSTWRPNPQRAMWLAMVIPGAGQIYNRKYWKLPLVYGGFMGCIYAMSWNNGMYKDYSQAYLDLMDDDPGTRSYEKFAHLGNVINSTNEERYKTIFKKRKDRFRRWRDLSFFVMVGVYAVSVIDAYVDAELSAFDISKDLSLKLEPTLMSHPAGGNNPLYASSLGLNCSINF